MKTNFDYLGSDLTVAPFAMAHDAQSLDLSLRSRPIRGQITSGATEAIDFATISGRDNLAHALLLRMLTPHGALSSLGHNEYGSRLHELVGQNKTSGVRDLCRAYALEVVAQEPRVESKAVALEFDPAAETPQNFVFSLAVKPVADDQAVSLNLEVAL